MADSFTIPADHAERHRWMARVLRASIAQQTRGLREQRGWTLGDLAAKVGVTAGRLAELESLPVLGKW